MKKGFTLLELVLIMGIVAVISVMGVGFWLNYKSTNDVDATARNIADTLRRAQDNAITGENFTPWGALFTNPIGAGGDYFILYSCSAACNTSGACGGTATEQTRSLLPSGVTFTTPADNSNVDSCFDLRTGKIQGAVKTVVIQSSLNSSLVRTITISSEGKVSID